ncbi:MAG TPA: ABC transporter permease [Tepidisphaeraceae bacterium]|jgi:Cu-processing system permease protein|nr:ABC transporter permease [Tepidisphaeraceae bacterium]
MSATISISIPRGPSLLQNVWTIAGRELRDAMRSRWFIMYTIAFAALGLGVSYVSAATSGGGMSGFGRTSAGLVNLVLLVVPLMALTAGAGSIASDRERGMLPYLLAQPVTRFELLFGKFVGLSLTLVASICLGFGAVAGALAWSGSATHPTSLLELAGLSIALALAMLSVGLLISVFAHRTGVATGTAVFVWLAFVFVSDLGLMAGAMTFKLPIEKLFALALLNPLQVFKMWSLQSVDASLDVLGPAGLYAQETYGQLLNLIFGTCLLLWMCVPLCIASIAFSRRSSP